jgi:cell wall-associated NlpC family hydrolase
MMIEKTRESLIIDYARECVGTPFIHQGRLIAKGLDCAGVLRHVLERIGLPYLDDKGYPSKPFDGMLNKIMDAEPSLQRVNNSDLMPGDVCVFRVKKAPQHIAIFTGDTVIHAYADTGRVVEQSYSAWAKNLTAVYRIIHE